MENDKNVQSASNDSTEKVVTSDVISRTIDLPVFYGVKAGMTRVFDKDGNHVSVTVIKLISNFISQVKTKEKDGYTAYQLSYGEKKEKLVNKPKKGILAKAKISQPLFNFTEVRSETISLDNLGALVSYNIFKDQVFIDVTSVSKGKGFQGVIKRHNFQGGPASHGSKFHRTGGSIGNRATPGKVWKNKKMPGHMGDKQVTIQNLQVYEINEEKGYLLIKGSVPGSKKSFVKISKALKK